MKRLLAVGPHDLVTSARRQTRADVETWPLESDHSLPPHQLPPVRAHGCEGLVEDHDQERVVGIFRDRGCLAVAVDANSSPREIVMAVTALAISWRYTDGGPQQG